MVVVTFQKIDKVFQRYILPSFSKIYLPKAVVSSQHTCLTLATLYLPSIGPAPVNLLRSGPGLKMKVMGVDHFCRMMTISKSKKNRCQHIRRQYETGHQVVAKVLATDNSSFTQVQNEICQLHQDECQRPCITFVRPGLPPGWTWWGSWKTLSRGFSQEGS